MIASEKSARKPSEVSILDPMKYKDNLEVLLEKIKKTKATEKLVSNPVQNS
jgi:hypothetical protein